MKILIVFVDMLRANSLNTFDSENEVTAVDKILRDWGGTVFTNCFTPGPDTPRSNGCLWSGLYPNENGCNSRLKYPRFFLNDTHPTFLLKLKNAGYSFNFFANQWTFDIGEFPKDINDIANFSSGVLLEDYLANLKIEDNSLSYFCLDDFHYVITDTDAQQKYLPLGYEKIAKTMEMIDNHLDVDSFDTVLVYSDHGFKKSNEKFHGNIYKQLNRDRTQIVMFLREKDNSKCIFNDKLCSILDVYPTLCAKAEIAAPSDLDGINLFSNEEHELLIIEDHKSFSAELAQTIEMWGVITKQGLAVVDCNKKWNADYPLTEEQKVCFDKVLSEKATGYAENTKLQYVKNYYDVVEKACPVYFDGELRKKHLAKDILLKSTIKKLIKKIFRV